MSLSASQLLEQETANRPASEAPVIVEVGKFGSDAKVVLGELGAFMEKYETDFGDITLDQIKQAYDSGKPDKAVGQNQIDSIFENSNAIDFLTALKDAGQDAWASAYEQLKIADQDGAQKIKDFVEQLVFGQGVATQNPPVSVVETNAPAPQGEPAPAAPAQQDNRPRAMGEVYRDDPLVNGYSFADMVAMPNLRPVARKISEEQMSDDDFLRIYGMLFGGLQVDQESPEFQRVASLFVAEAGTRQHDGDTLEDAKNNWLDKPRTPDKETAQISATDTQSVSPETEQETTPEKSGVSVKEQLTTLLHGIADDPATFGYELNPEDVREFSELVFAAIDEISTDNLQPETMRTLLEQIDESINFPLGPAILETLLASKEPVADDPTYYHRTLAEELRMSLEPVADKPPIWQPANTEKVKQIIVQLDQDSFSPKTKDDLIEVTYKNSAVEVTGFLIKYLYELSSMREA